MNNDFVHFCFFEKINKYWTTSSIFYLVIIRKLNKINFFRILTSQLISLHGNFFFKNNYN